MTAPEPHCSSGATETLSWLIVPLAAGASLAGLLVPGIYLEPPFLLPQARGQDLVTLFAAAALGLCLLRMRRGSERARLIHLGLLGYMLYTYTGASFAYVFNRLFLVYIALFSLSVFSLVTACSAIKPEAVRARFDDSAPRRPVIGFILFIGSMLSLLWLARLVPHAITGVVPADIVRSNGGMKFVFTLDLGLVTPLSAMTAYWLWRRLPWGYVLAGVILIKAATMGLALLSMGLFSWRDGQPVDGILTTVWVIITTGGGVLSAWFYRHCRD